MAQTQNQTQGKTPDFTHDTRLIKRLVDGKIIRVCYDGVRYNVWTDTGSKRWFMYYRFRVHGDYVEMYNAQVGCLDGEILIEPTDGTLDPYYINHARLIREVVQDAGKIIRICTHSTQYVSEAHGPQYSVWIDTGSKKWFMYYVIEISNNKAKIIKKLHNGCLENDILIEPVGD